MCGLLFAQNIPDIDFKRFSGALRKQQWRGPDYQQVKKIADNVFLGHVRLAILDPDVRASQPFRSQCGRYQILFNGEIYNHLKIRKELNLNCITMSDTETILEGFVHIGGEIFEKLEGMFAVVIWDAEETDFWAARDRYGIKPLFHYPGELSGAHIYASECASIRSLVDCEVDQESVREWKLIRRPAQRKSFFKNIEEVLPGSIVRNGKTIRQLEKYNLESRCYDLKNLQKLISESVVEHELSDVENVALLSGGIDSSLITMFSNCNEVYTVGTEENNEFCEAAETARLLGRTLKIAETDAAEIRETWRELIRIKGEPLSVPNEALIYKVCSTMTQEQKVVLTGEGADEIFFGYDRIFRWASEQKSLTLEDFLNQYGYNSLENLTDRLRCELELLLNDKTPIEFVEDFFFSYHLPCLLRRMDFASMAASKEARVPFVYRKIIAYMYRQSSSIKIDSKESKIPLRRILEDNGLDNVTKRKKIGFSATLDAKHSRFDEYERFQDFNLEVLGW